MNVISGILRRRRIDPLAAEFVGHGSVTFLPMFLMPPRRPSRGRWKPSGLRNVAAEGEAVSVVSTPADRFVAMGWSR